MDKQEIERVREMVIFGLYRVCLVNGYDSVTFGKLKDEQNRLFDNYISNRSGIIEELIKTVESELKESNDLNYKCKEGSCICTDVGYVQEWFNEYKDILKDRYCL